jgi:hypothetical protein
MKKEKSFKVMLKNMYPFSNLEELKQDINSKGHVITNIWNVLQRITKEFLPMFFVELKPAANNKDVYNVNFLLQYKIKFEQSHAKREMPQCSKFQRYGHTKHFYFRQRERERCLKCAGNHVTVKCARKTRSEDVKCVTIIKSCKLQGMPNV